MPTTIPFPIAASVPGCVHTDLRNADAIEDPYGPGAESRLRWIGESQWTYQCVFDYTARLGIKADLVFEGLDTIAEIRVNGEILGRTQNMHRTYRFPVEHLLRDGSNDLSVSFDPPLRWARNQQARLGTLPGPRFATEHPIGFIRKMACNFGWDWGPELLTSGIWRPVVLHEWSAAQLTTVRPRMTVEGTDGLVSVLVGVDRASSETGPLTLTASIGGHSASSVVPEGGSWAQVEVQVPNVDCWWPHSHGTPVLYDLVVELHLGESAVIDAWQRRVGFRSVELNLSGDEERSSFAFVINGQPIFARGACWIPPDCFPARVSQADVRRCLEQAVACNVNMIRVWGGGVYPDQDFMAVCDELGLMVWQDFMFACSAYPEAEPFLTEIEAEARDNITRLLSHPCLVIWVGNNESFIGWQTRDWVSRVGSRGWGSTYWFNLLPRLIEELDGSRPYYPGSPFSGSLDVPVNDDGHGPVHLWDIWNRDDYLDYRRRMPRFVAEFGWQAPASLPTLKSVPGGLPMTVGSRLMGHVQRAKDGNAKLTVGLGRHFPIPEDFRLWLAALQLNQARALKTAIEHFRTRPNDCMGALIWQLNDCWPASSWAIIDSQGRRKTSWYAVRDGFADQLLTIQPGRDGTLRVYAVNDSSSAWEGELVVTRRLLTGGFGVQVPGGAPVHAL